MDKESLSKLSLFWIYCSFFVCGVVNNFVYCFVLSAAKDILGDYIPVGVVLVCNIVPGWIAQNTAPFWMDKFSYLFRVCLFVFGQTVSISFVAFIPNIIVQLIGMVVGGFTCSLGESSFLAMSSAFFPGVVTTWSSGTGGAGIIGSLAYLLLHAIIGLNYRYCNMIILWVPFVYLLFFVVVLRKYVKVDNKKRMEGEAENAAAAEEAEGTGFTGLVNDSPGLDSNLLPNQQPINAITKEKEMDLDSSEAGGDGSSVAEGSESLLHTDERDSDAASSSSTSPSPLSVSIHPPPAPRSFAPPPFTLKQRAKALWHLLPRIFPLFLVYVSEYLVNQGVTPELNYPKDKLVHKFFCPNEYVYFAFLYQVGVFVGRSSTSLIRIRWTLVCSLMQVGVLAFFLVECLVRFLPTIYISYVITLFEGVIGGTVYANTFYLLNKDEAPAPHIKTFQLGAGTMASSGGITVAALLALAVQPLLKRYKRSSVGSCPVA